MELYTTKKISSVDEFGLASGLHETLPCIHVITPEVIVRVDANDNLYIADSPDATCIPNLIKIKKLLCKQVGEESKKVMDDIIWVKTSPSMLYKKGSSQIPINKMLLNCPVKLQISCRNNFIYNVGKPYNVANMFWVIDYVIVDESFDWATLQSA